MIQMYFYKSLFSVINGKDLKCNESSLHNDYMSTSVA
jgi:hypothetical protein